LLNISLKLVDLLKDEKFNKILFTTGVYYGNCKMVAYGISDPEK
jgi:hypothetical protein